MAKKRRMKKRRTGTGKAANRLVMAGSILLSAVLIVVMILNAPIIDYRTLTNGTMTNQQISIMKYFKVWQPLVQKEGTLQKPVVTDASALNLKEDTETQDPKNDGLDLQQIVEGQYTVLFMGMDESGKLADVNWVFQFDIFAGTMNVLQIPRDCYMPDYANPSTNKFNSIYGTGQEKDVTPIQRAVNAIQENFGLTIDCYVKLVCTDIANIVDSIGGIPITLPEEIMYEADKVLKAGEQTLNGQQAEWFVRFRREYDEGDIGRVKAQRIFLAAAMEKLLDMSQTELMSAMQKIYKNEWIATDLSLEQISMLADFASERLTMDGVNVYMVPGEGLMHEGQSVYSIHKTEAIDMINAHFRPYQNEMYYDESTIVELVEESEYEDTYSDTEENLNDIHNGDTEDGRQNIYSRDDEE
ncbi:MAG: LCP family protein [Oscillospiraceae bacterium]|nr:LCP family protein [Oscillospiraceae bacterium]